jgi:hypothetical protein
VRDHGKCSAAVARLAAFIADFPQSPNQTHVLQYHDIVKTLEETCGQDLSQFRIAPERINSRANIKTRRQCRHRLWQVLLLSTPIFVAKFAGLWVMSRPC